MKLGLAAVTFSSCDILAPSPEVLLGLHRVPSLSQEPLSPLLFPFPYVWRLSLLWDDTDNESGSMSAAASMLSLLQPVSRGNFSWALPQLSLWIPRGQSFERVGLPIHTCLQPPGTSHAHSALSNSLKISVCGLLFNLKGVWQYLSLKALVSPYVSG